LEIFEIVADAEFERLGDIVALDEGFDLAGKFTLFGFTSTAGNA
jgi:hypothetical protein